MPSDQPLHEHLRLHTRHRSVAAAIIIWYGQAMRHADLPPATGAGKVLRRLLKTGA